LKKQQVIMGSITATLSAIALGYVGAQYFNQNAMYTIAGAMMGVGASTQIKQLKTKSQVSPPKQLAQSSISVTAVSEEPPQQIPAIQQPTYQTIEPKIEHPVEVIESQSSQELRAEIDPIIERFVTAGLEDF
jgi:hypothetical protein